MSLYTESNINPSTNIIINLKNTLQLTERIKNKILTKNTSFNYKTFRPPKKINFSYIDDSQYYNNKKEKSFSNDNHAYDYNKNNGKIGKKDNNINIVKVKGKSKGKEKNKLNVIRNDFLEKNMKLRKENLILEKEINNYKEQFFSNKNLYDNKYYKNSLPKKVEYYKNKYHSSIDNNIKLLEQIFKIQEISQTIENNINKICSKNENIFKKVENKNRQNAEIQIINEENEIKYKELKEKNEMFNKDLERLKLELVNIKNKQNNLNILKESNIKQINDFEKIINNLTRNKNKLEEELNEKADIMNYNTELIYKNNKNLNLYKHKISNLQNKFNKLIYEKDQLIQKNFKIKNNINNYQNNNYNKINGMLLEKKYQKLKEDNALKIQNINNSDNEIDKLKQYLDNISINIQNYNEYEYEYENIFIENGQSNFNFDDLDYKLEEAIKKNNIAKINLNLIFKI